MPPAQPTSSLAIPENLAVETPPASSSTAVSPDVQEKLAYPGGNGQWSRYQPWQYSVSQAPAPVETFPAPVSSPIQTSEAAPSVASPIQTSEAAPPSSSPAVASATAAQTSAASSPVSSGTFWAKSPMSPLSGGSGAKDVLTQANYWRKQWLSLPPFVWSAVLANNSYMTTTQPTTYTTNSDGTTTPHNEGGAEVMGHDLYPGSSAQCIASGDDTTITDGYTPFEKAFLMWICEEPNANIPCSALGYNGPVTETGHADIIKGTVGQIGCYYMNAAGKSTGMWTCDFQEPVGSTQE